MPYLKIIRKNFYHDLYERQNIPKCISRISFANTDNALHKSENLSNNELDEKKIYSIQVIPDYFTITYDSFLSKKITKEFRLGYASKVNEFKDVRSYVKSQYGKNAKSIFKRIKRLETCFDVKYVMFQGRIERAQYDFLMESLYNMLLKRFKQRNDSNYHLSSWDKLYNNIFNLIKLKKASLFVIYNGDEPIQINIQYHFKDILVSSVASYNIDYQTFGLGNTAVYKQIEWCIENNYTIYDQAHGDLEYKRRWSNLIYNFDHHIVYSKNDLISTLRAFIEIPKVIIKAFLRKKKAVDSIKRIKTYFSKKKPKENNTESRFEIFEIENLKEELKHFSLINWRSIEYKFLMKSVYDFLYYNFEHYNNLKVFQNNSKSNKFIIKGKDNFQKIVFS